MEPRPKLAVCLLACWDVYPFCWGKGSDPATSAVRAAEVRPTYVQNDQHWCPHCRGATEGQDESHSAPDPEADEDERDKDQLLISHRSVVLGLVRLREERPVLRERLVLCGQHREQM